MLLLHARVAASLFHFLFLRVQKGCAPLAGKNDFIFQDAPPGTMDALVMLDCHRCQHRNRFLFSFRLHGLRCDMSDRHTSGSVVRGTAQVRVAHTCGDARSHRQYLAAAHSRTVHTGGQRHAVLACACDHAKLCGHTVLRLGVPNNSNA
jgi:hypothetical protein